VPRSELAPLYKADARPFRRSQNDDCMVMDETLLKVSEKVKNFAIIYLVDISQVPDFNKVCSFKIAMVSQI
jgi:hypothetical protein